MSIIDGRARGLKVRLLAAATTLLAVAAANAGAAGDSQDGDVVRGAVSATRQPAFRPGFMAGEVIVQLRDMPTGGIGILSDDASVQRDQATLLRLQAKYGLESRGPVFKRLHAQLAPGQWPGTAERRVGPKPGARGPCCGTMCSKPSRTCGQSVPELKADPAVEHAQPNYIYYPCRTPNDPDFADQYAHQLIQMEDAWDISTGSRDIVVAVLDTGVDVNHPDLKDNIWVNKAEIPGNKSTTTATATSTISTAGTSEATTTTLRPNEATPRPSPITAPGGRGHRGRRQQRQGRLRRQLAVQHHGPAGEPRISPRRKRPRPWSTPRPTGPAWSI